MKSKWMPVLLTFAYIMLVGCTNGNVAEMKQEYIYGEVNEDFYFVIQDIFTIKTLDGIVVTGINYESPIYAGTEVDVLSGDQRTPTSIGLIEEYGEGTVDGVPKERNIGILLTGLTKDDVHVGDIIVLKDCQKELNK